MAVISKKLTDSKIVLFVPTDSRTKLAITFKFLIIKECSMLVSCSHALTKKLGYLNKWVKNRNLFACKHQPL